MTTQSRPTPDAIRQARIDNPKMRERDLADSLGISEAELLAAHIGQGVTRISSELDKLIPAVMELGETMALTRNDSCVIEKHGVYEDYRGGPHAALVVNEDIDLRMFPRHWHFGFAIEKALPEGGTRRSLQIFDAAGDAVHKIFLKDPAIADTWDDLLTRLAPQDTSAEITVSPRKPTEPAKGDPAKAQRLRDKWDKMTDTHQFLQMVNGLKMNRLGAYRLAGAPYVRPLPPQAVEDLLQKACDTALPIMIFVGNMGCIEIHTGPIHSLKPMGPWINVLDPRFNLHLRGDHIAEVWQVTKSTRRGDAVSVEAFDKDGAVILQIFGVLADPDAAAKWNETVASLPSLPEPSPEEEVSA
ncbi:hemin-degrading factor [Shimia marina]|uniref:Hemin transport protein HemS n=1 Tax=Shimia marina TaxID=321267 RepID=A0A0P1FBR9_9RHOB|nr:hemin-degrading factor [Shimia marina]CUH52018.1 Hemin transport protein HemS [Shimia marina]SFE62030.1 putative hemin transport protein [Shimia marina]